MKIGLIDVDGHNFPNLALMKLSAWHKAQGDTVEWWWSDFFHYDLVYMSKVFGSEYSPDVPEPLNADRVIKGGTGYAIDLENGVEVYHKERDPVLPPEIENIYPDYSIYFDDNDLEYDEETGVCLGLATRERTKRDTAYGFLTRGCPRGCHFCIVAGKEGRKSVKVADLSEWWRGQKNIKLLDPNLLACKEHMELLGQLEQSGAYVDFTQGLDCRLLTAENIAAINRVKLKEIHFAWDYMKEEKAVLRGLRLYAELAEHRPHGQFATVYCLTNYDTTMAENLHRIYTLRDMGYSPYVMIYDKPNAPREIRFLQSWCNNRLIFRAEPDFYKYDPKRG